MTTNVLALQPWVSLKAIATASGLSVNALREYIKKGKLHPGYHYIKAQNGRVMIHAKRFGQWLEGTEG